MKVICVKEPDGARDIFTGKKESVTPIVVGETYTVVDEKYIKQRLYYDLEEIKFPDKIVWHPSHHFAPVSDIDETEMERDWMCVKNKV